MALDELECSHMDYIYNTFMCTFVILETSLHGTGFVWNISCGVVGRFGIRNLEGKGEEEESETDSQSHYFLASTVNFNERPL